MGLRSPVQSKGPLTVEEVFIPGTQKDFERTFPKDGYSLKVKTGGMA